jgi:anti-sigma factor RsiW
MFDFMRDRGSTAEDKRQETMSAYLDNALTAAERERFDGQLARDDALRAEVERMRLLKLQMRAMPRRRVPRSFSLDPALYGRPKAQPMMQLYPVLRGATALTAFFLIFTLALGMFRGQFSAEQPTASVMVTESAAEEEIAAFEAAESAPAELPAPESEEARAMATAEPELEAAAELAAQDTMTGTFAIEALPPVEGTLPADSEEGVTGVPQTELGAGAAAATAEPAAALPTQDPTLAPREELADSTANTAAPAETVAETQAETTFATLLRPLQIGLGIAFLLLLILWLIARRRVGSL